MSRMMSEIKRDDNTLHLTLLLNQLVRLPQIFLGRNTIS